MTSIQAAQRQLARSCRTRGISLAAVVAVVEVVLLIGVLLASLAVLNLSLSSGLANGLSDEMLARSTVTQFIYEQSQVSVSSPLTGSATQNLLARYQSAPVFPDGGQRLGGTVAVTFDPSQPWYSVDNSLGDTAAAGWLDQGQSTTSVPPYSIDLLMTVDTGHQPRHFEAIIQRRWPYALASGKSVCLEAGVPPSGPSTVSGPMYVFDHIFNTNDAVTPAHVSLPNDMFASLEQYSAFTPAAVNVGAAVTQNVSQTMASWSQAGNSLDGAVDFQGPAYVPLGFPQNTVYVNSGTPPATHFQIDLSSRLQQLFAAADSTVGSLSGQTLPAGAQPFPTQATQPLAANNATLLSSPVVLGDQPPATNTGQVYQPGSLFVFSSGTTSPANLCNFFLNEGSCCSSNNLSYSNNNSIELHDCTLFVNGDLNLSGEQPTPSSPPPILLSGSHATLIVNGALILRNGALNSDGKAMVIYCKRLVSNASGTYNGLIMVEDTAALFPGGHLDIHGALVCGGANPVYFITPGDHPPVAAPYPWVASGTTLWDTTLTWDPSYCTSLHSIGTPTVLMLRKLP